MGGLDILLLTRLGSTTQEDDQGIAVPAEIDPIAGARVYPTFENTGTHALRVGEVALFHPDQRRRHLGRSLSTKAVEPSGIRTAAFGVKVLPDLNHYYQVTDMLPFNALQRRVLVRESRTYLPIKTGRLHGIS